jgi:hypothetical protein
MPTIMMVAYEPRSNDETKDETRRRKRRREYCECLVRQREVKQSKIYMVSGGSIR